ncbi:unnamed protein product, partial [Didymodactylos carnosus]
GSELNRNYRREKMLRRLLSSIKDKFKEIAEEKFGVDFRRFDKEDMLLFPDIGFQSQINSDNWNLVCHGWRYEGSKRNKFLGLSISSIGEAIAYLVSNAEQILYLNDTIQRDRIKPFLVEDESHEVIKINIGKSSHIARTDNEGQFRLDLTYSNDDVNQLKKDDIISYTAIGDNGDSQEGVIRLIERNGLSIISDIDDTIKISEVLDKIRLIANTFIHPFKPVLGMADLYQQWKTRYNCSFHYLSAMPDQLYILTQEFINNNNFPNGSFHMRHFHWASKSIFNFVHSQSTFNHKLTYLRYFLSNTLRQFILVGDSGEKDPEVYGVITREYPERIRAIFIRQVSGSLASEERFSAAFENIPKAKWMVFDDPKQVPIDLIIPPRA